MAMWKAATPAAVLGHEEAFPGLPVQRAVTPSELALHSTKKDSWIAIRNKVYAFRYPVVVFVSAVVQV
jgi:cytochrome b involved in lipid metabolism